MLTWSAFGLADEEVFYGAVAVRTSPSVIAISVEGDRLANFFIGGSTGLPTLDYTDARGAVHFFRNEVHVVLPDADLYLRIGLRSQVRLGEDGLVVAALPATWPAEKQRLTLLKHRLSEYQEVLEGDWVVHYGGVPWLLGSKALMAQTGAELDSLLQQHGILPAGGLQTEVNSVFWRSDDPENGSGCSQSCSVSCLGNTCSASTAGNSCCTCSCNQEQASCGCK
jgi:hypothetical protein